MDFLKGDIKIPGTNGKVPKAAAAGGLVLTFALIWRYRTTHQNSSTAAAAPGQYPADGTTGNPDDPYSTDPATGTTYGDEASGGNLAATGGVSGAGQAGDAFPWDGTYNQPGDPNSLDSNSGLTYGNDTGPLGGASGGSGGSGQAGPPFSTNAQWSQYAIAQLSSTVSQKNLTSALGLYLNGQKVTAAQKQLIDDAIAIAGQPPVAGHGGFPPSINAGEPSTGGKTYAANPVRGLKVTQGNTAGLLPPPGGGKGQPAPVTLTVSWDAEPHAATYDVKVTAGHTTAHTETVSGHTAQVTGLRGATRYDITVLARPARSSARPASTSFTTRRAP